MADRKVTASWAWISKRPGDTSYGILATSEDVSFGKYIGQYVTGTPDSGMDESAPGAPPWVAFGPFVRDGDPLLSVSVQDWWQGSDSSGRQIWPQRFFLTRYEEVAAAGASYRQLWEALKDLRLPNEPCAPVRLTLPGKPTAEIARTVEHYGPDRMTALAAILLESKIALADAARLHRDERLAVLDAVLALLPYGLRRIVGASTAVDNTVTHEMDLVFAEFSNEQVLVSLLPGSPLPAPRTELGQAYREMLLEKMANCGVHAVVEHLWLASGAHRLDRPDESLATLSELDFDGSLLRRLSAGLATRPEVLAFFQRGPSQVASTWQSRRMDPGMRRTALLLLLDDADPAAASSLAHHWQTIQPAVLQVASEWLDAGDKGLPSRCVQVAALAEDDDGFLRELVASGQVTRAARASRCSGLADLLLGYVPPARGQLPNTLDQVWRDQDQTWQWELFRGVLAEYLRTSSAAAGWAAWLCGPGSPGAPPWIADLRLALLGAGSAGAPEQLSYWEDPTWAAIVLSLAAAHGNLPAVLWLAEDSLLTMTLSETGQAMDPVLGVLNIDLWPAGVPPHSIAVADAMQALRGNSPAGFPAGLADELDYDGYLDGLQHVLGSASLPAQRRADLASRFLQHAVPDSQPAAAAAGRNPGGIRLLNAWSADRTKRAYVVNHIAAIKPAARPLDEDLDAAYWTLLAEYPQLAAYAGTNALATVARRAAASPDAELTRRTDPENGLHSSPLALACYRVRMSGLPVSEIMRALAKAGISNIGARGLDDVLREFNVLLYHADGRPHYLDGHRVRPQEDLLTCYARIWEGDLGGEFAEAFRSYLAKKFREEIAVRKSLLKANDRAKPSRFSTQRRGWQRLSRPKWHAVAKRLRRERKRQLPAGPEQSTGTELTGMQQ